MHDRHETAHDQGPPACFHLGGGLKTELVAHLPFSVTSVTLGLILAGVICFLAPSTAVDPGTGHPHEGEAGGENGAPGELKAEEFHGHFIELFHLFHPAHILFSAAATTAMFRRYDGRLLRTLAVGLSGALLVCGLSDYIFPHFSLLILGKAPSHWHICMLQHPQLVYPFALVGVALGWFAAASIEKATYFSHTLHVSISTMASIFYLVGPMGRIEWIDRIGSVFFLTIVAVMVPCCFSDIFYPLLLTPRGREDYAQAGHAHKH